MDSQRFIVQGFGYKSGTDEVSKKFMVETLPRTPYYYLKLVEYNGDRIDYSFSPRRKVLETFENQVFNVIGWNIENKRGKTTIHTRHDLADMVATSILNHRLNNEDYEIYNSIFPEFIKKNQKGFDLEFLENKLKQYGERIKINNQGYIVDELFLIDRNGGQCYIWNRDIDKPEGFICVHPQGVVNDQIIIEGDEKKVFNAHSQTILSKINYLLSPSLQCPHRGCTHGRICRVFFNQLPSKHKGILSMNYEEVSR